MMLTVLDRKYPIRGKSISGFLPKTSDKAPPMIEKNMTGTVPIQPPYIEKLFNRTWTSFLTSVLLAEKKILCEC